MSKIKKYIPQIFVVLIALVLLLLALPFSSAILLAVIFSLALHPFRVKYLKRKFNISKTVSVYLLVFFITVIQIPFLLAFLKVFREIKGFLESEKMSEFLSQLSQKTDFFVKEAIPVRSDFLKEYIDEISKNAATRAGDLLLEQSSSILSAIPSVFIFIFFFSCCLYYFLIDSDRIWNFSTKISFFNETFLEKVIKVLQRISQSVLYSAVVTGLVQALIMSGTIFIVDFEYVIVIFFLTFFFAQIPIIGTFPVVLSLTFVFYVQSDFKALIFVLILGAISGVADNVARVMTLNKTDKLHPLFGLIVSIGGIFILGPIGVFVGPILALLFLRLIDEDFEKYISLKDKF